MVATHHQALQIPIDAVSRLEDAQYVYVVREEKPSEVKIS